MIKTTIPRPLCDKTIPVELSAKGSIGNDELDVFGHSDASGLSKTGCSDVSGQSVLLIIALP